MPDASATPEELATLEAAAAEILAAKPAAVADEWDEKARELSKRLRYAFVSNVLDLEDIATFAREAYQRGRNEADTAAERRGIERAAKWQTMETAPRTGDPILAFYPGAYQGKGGVFLVLWFVDQFVTYPGSFRHMTFTHWMPAPGFSALAQPAGASDKEGMS